LSLVGLLFIAILCVVVFCTKINPRFIQFWFISIGLGFMVFFPLIIDTWFPDVAGLGNDALQLYFSMMLNFFIVFIGILGIAVSILLGQFYLQYLGKKEDAATYNLKLYWNKECTKIRNQFIVFLFFMIYSFFVIYFNVIYPVVERMPFVLDLI